MKFQRFTLLFFILLSIVHIVSAQSNTELKTDIEKIKEDIIALKSEMKSVKKDNDYLKNVLKINTPILQISKEGNDFRITKVEGNKSEKSISINFLVESLDNNISANLDNFTLVDMEGNQYEIDFHKSSSPYLKLSVNVPINVKITFSGIKGEIEFVRLFKFRSRNNVNQTSIKVSSSIQEFRDLNVIWK